MLVLVFLDDGVIGDVGFVSGGDEWALEKGGAVDKHPPLDRVVFLDHLGVDVRDEEDGREDCQATAGAHGDGSNIPRRLLVQAEVRGALVDDGEGADGASDEEEEW